MIQALYFKAELPASVVVVPSCSPALFLAKLGSKAVALLSSPPLGGRGRKEESEQPKNSLGEEEADVTALLLWLKYTGGSGALFPR